jgi:hypothetical protein
MALETATTIDELVTSNPASGDAVSQGDEHLRLIKSVLQGDFMPYTHAASGSIALPDGLRVKWGPTTNSASGAAVTTNFSSAFASTCYVVLLTPGANAAVHGTVESTSASGFTSSLWGDTGARVAGYSAFYIAIGK